MISGAQLAHHSICGGVAALGFGVLFNIGPRLLPWCAVSGALALAIRTTGLQLGWSLEAASFAAALAVGGAVRVAEHRLGVSRNSLDVAGCIPMIPGGFAAKAILGLFALSASPAATPDQVLIQSVAGALRVMFTIGAMGTGLALPSLLLRVRRPL